jgi:hypothetical protein
VFFADRTPLMVSAELDKQWPADDQRYTPVGVILRYEHEIALLMPYGDGGTRILLEDDDDGFRHLYAYVGDFWGASYDQETDAVPSARAVPSSPDLRTAAKELALAEERQGVCYGWDVEIRSGRREGRLVGSSRGGVGQPLHADRCDGSLLLWGWIDPLAGRFTRKGDPGAWELRWKWFLPGDIPQAALDAIDTPENELIEGHTQQLSDDGSRAGKGLLEHIWALPLLAQEVPRVASVPIRLVDAPAGAAPAPAARSDESRFTDADDSWLSIPIAFIQVAAVGAILIVLFTLPVALGARLVRRLRPLRSRRRPPAR